MLLSGTDDVLSRGLTLSNAVFFATAEKLLRPTAPPPINRGR